MPRLRLALGFLTSIPVRVDSPQPGDFGRAGRWFPAVGLGLGVLLVAGHALLDRAFPALLSAALTVALWVSLTGGLHLDGLADCCDGLLASASPERRLEILRDPRTGSFGAIGLVLFLLLKVVAVASLVKTDDLLAPPGAAFPLGGPVMALLLAPALARWLILPVARQPLARPGGLGADFALGVDRATLVIAALLPLAFLPIGGLRALVAILLAHLVTLGIVRLARSRLGGITGDVLGLTVELAELTVLLVYAIRH